MHAGTHMPTDSFYVCFRFFRPYKIKSRTARALPLFIENCTACHQVESSHYPPRRKRVAYRCGKYGDLVCFPAWG
jgi:hypothetical protein